MAGPATAFFDQPDSFDAHAALDRFHHVIDGETGDRYCGQRFHLNAGLAGDLDAGFDDDARQLGVRRDVDLDLRDGERVAERDQFVRAFGRLNAGDAGYAEHIALLGVTLAHDVEGFARHHHAAFSHRLALGRLL